MAAGLPYDSDAGRDYAACVTAIMCGEAYCSHRRSPSCASPSRPLPRFPKERISVTRGACPGLVLQPRTVPRRHPHAPRLGEQHQCDARTPACLKQQGHWDEALSARREHGYRNSQVTVLAPTGTIGFMMDCDTTGIEPDLALISTRSWSAAA